MISCHGHTQKNTVCLQLLCFHPVKLTAVLVNSDSLWTHTLLADWDLDVGCHPTARIGANLMSPRTDVRVCEPVLFLSHREGCGALPQTPGAPLHGEAPSPLVPCCAPQAEPPHCRARCCPQLLGSPNWASRTALESFLSIPQFLELPDAQQILRYSVSCSLRVLFTYQVSPAIPRSILVEKCWKQIKFYLDRRVFGRKDFDDVTSTHQKQATFCHELGIFVKVTVRD